MNNRQKKTFELIFKDPVAANVPWKDIESLPRAPGCEISEGNGSRVRLALGGVRAVFHRPHPNPETDKGAVKSMRKFLTNAGHQP